MMQRMKGTLRPGRKAGVLALAVLLLTCVLMAGAVSATTTYYVNESGDNSNVGTSPDSPFKTIQRAVDNATADDRILVAEGTYDAFKIDPGKEGLTIEGTVKDNSLKTIIRTLNESSPTWESNGCGGIDISSPFITLKNLSIQSDGYTNGGLWYASPVGHWYENTNNKTGLTIDNCEITNSAADGKGIAIFFVASNITISNTSISGFNHGWHMEGSAGMGDISITDSSFDVTGSAINYIPYVAPTSSDPAFTISKTKFISGNVTLWDYANQMSIDTSSTSINSGIQNVELSDNTYEDSNIILINFKDGQEDEVTSPDKTPVMRYSELKYGVELNRDASELVVINYGSSSQITYTKGDGFWKGDDGSVCDEDGNPCSAKIGNAYYPTLKGALDEAKNGDTVTLLQDVSLTNAALTINKEITLTATDSADKPTLTVPQVLIAVPNVTLDNLKIQQTAGTNIELYTIQVTAQGDVGQITVTDSEIIPVTEGRGFSNNAGAGFDITFTGNTVKAANEGDQLAYAIYINGYDNKYVFQENIIGSCSVSQFGFDLYSGYELPEPVDISKNYWGGEDGPSLELFVGGKTDKQPEITGQNVYYTQLNDDGTIDKNSIYPPVEPTPLPPSGGSSSGGNMDNAYRVLFNDGSTTLSVQTDLSSGDKLTKPETPVKDGYTFAGWYKDSACTQAWDFETGISGDMTLYAKWTAAGSSGETEATATPTSTAVTTPQPTKTQTAAATTSAPEATTAAGVSPTLTQAPAPVAGALFGLLAAGVLLRRRFQ